MKGLFSNRSSRSSSLGSLNIFNDENGENGENATNVEVENVDLQNFEQNLPTNVDEIESYQRNYTKEHPLGLLLLKIASNNIELCKKANLNSDDILSLDDICDKFTKAIKLERNRNSNKLLKFSNDVENSLLSKELNFSLINQTIEAPFEFSSVPVLTTSAKTAEALKIFPTKGNQKFYGNNQGASIVEFLTSINTAQKLLNLSKKEFYEMLLRCVGGNVYEVIASCVSRDVEPTDIYFNLIQLYDHRLSSGEAKKKLVSFKAPKGYNLARTQHEIARLSDRVASQLPSGGPREAMFDSEANNALVQCLPYKSSCVVIDTINNLTSRTGRGPSFMFLCRALHKYTDTINKDISMNGISMQKDNNYNNNNFLRKNPRYRANYVGQNTADRKKDNMQKYRQNHASNFQNRQTNRPNTVYEMRNDKNFKMKKFQNSAKNERAFNINSNDSKGKFCSLCGNRGHLASEICYKMKSDDGRIQMTVPTYKHCPECEKKLGKQLYHPTHLCFLRDTYPGKKNNKDK